MDLLEELLKNIAECLQCSICQNIFKSVTLPCGHSYCIDCISEYRKAKALTRIDCPECRHRFQPPIKFKKNVTLCDMAKMYHDFRRYVSNEESTGPQMAMVRHQQTNVFMMRRSVCFDVAMFSNGLLTSSI